MSRARRCHVDERGLVAVMTALMMVLMLGVVALVVDLGNARQHRREAQNGADAAALAAGETVEAGSGTGGGIIPWPIVVTQVKNYARVNDDVPTSAWVGCSDPYALSYHPDSANGNTCISADLSVWPAASAATLGDTINRVRVHLPSSTVKASFARAVGNGDLTVGASATVKTVMTVKAITTSTTVAGGPCALCILGSGFTLDGQNGDVTIAGGNVIVNSTSGLAAQLKNNGNVKITTSGGSIGGPGSCAPSWCSNFSGSGFSPAPTQQDAVLDPLRDVPQCGDGSRGLLSLLPKAVPDPCPTAPVITTKADKLPFELSPGIYDNGIAGSHHLAAGIYILKDDMVLNGNDSITGDGVMLYFACSSPVPNVYPTACASNGGAGTTGARIKATGNGQFSLKLTAPTSGTYQGLLIFADRNNNAVQTWRGNGTNENGGASGSSGTIYLYKGQMDLRGNGYTLSSQIIADSFTMNGNPSTVVIAYDLTKTAPETTTTTKTDYVPGYDDNGLSG